MKPGFKLILRVLISVSLMAVLLYWLVDLDKAVRAVKGADPLWLLGLAVVVLGDRILMSEKWRLLLTCRKVALGHWEALRVYFIATFAGCFLPSTVGGDALRVAAISGPGRPSELLAASVMVERAVGFPAAALAALMGVMLLAGLVADIPGEVLWWSLAFLSVGALAVVVSFCGPLGRRLEEWSRNSGGKGPIWAWLANFAASYSLYRHHRPALIWFFLLSLLEQAAPVLAVWCAARALDFDVSLLEVAAVTPVAQMFTRIPVSVSGFGVVEGLYMAFFGLVGVAPTQAFLLGFITSIAVVVTTLPGAVIYAWGGFRGDRGGGQKSREAG